MEKFSKLKPKNEFAEAKDKVIYSDDYFKIIEYEDWHIIQEKDAIVCIPYLIESNQFVIRYEYIPPFKYADGQEYHITVISGSIEQGETAEKALVRELEEEAGIVLREDYEYNKCKIYYGDMAHPNSLFVYFIF